MVQTDPSGNRDEEDIAITVSPSEIVHLSKWHTVERRTIRVTRWDGLQALMSCDVDVKLLELLGEEARINSRRNELVLTIDAMLQAIDEKAR